LATIIKRLNTIISEILGEEMDLSADTMLREVSADQNIESLGLSSIDVIDLISQSEIEFDVEINEHEIVNFKTVGDLVKYIEDNQ
jgi:acyl carrier protein